MTHFLIFAMAFMLALIAAAIMNRRRHAYGFIQLFATQTTLLNSDGNDLSPEMKTFYDKALLVEAQAQLVHHQFGQKRPIPKNGGKTIEFRKFSPLAKALTALTEGVTPAGNQLNVTSITATVSQFGDYIALSDVLELTAIDNVVLETTRLLGQQAGLTMDTVVRNILAAGTNVMYAPKINAGVETPVTSRAALDATCVLTVDLIKQAATKLKASNAPKINGDYVAIVHPYAVYDIMKDPEWKQPHTYKDTTNLYEGEIGKLYGVRFVESTEAKIWRGADLASDSRTLSVNNSGGYTNATSVKFDGGTVEANALAGRYVIIGGVSTKITANTADTLTLETAVSCADNDVIYPGEGGSGGLSVFGTLIIAANAYGVTDIEGGGIETIVKQKGSAGTSDPLNQRSTIGWKAMETAEILMQPYMVRIEHMSSRWSASAEAN